ncbi:MAG: hydroxymethylglutaryl-CoA synthase [Candidatus Micrarchaeota archaeon]|nr:hydroxymethylglutaryl-CoA synthase [Candidatus Micrarchaeota archaeon]
MAESIGIVGYGVDVPRYRIKASEIARVWGEEENRIVNGLGLSEKSVPALDQDAATLAVEAARRAVRHSGINPQLINSIFVGSESHPYAVKPTATIVAEAINAAPVLFAADHEFACKGGTAGIINSYALLKSGEIEYGLGIGTDTSQGSPGDALEYSAGAGAGAFIVGKKDVIAEIKGIYAYTTDTPDFWRREHAIYPSHGGRFTGAPGYFKHVQSGAKGIMEKMGTRPSDYAYAVFHQPNGKFPRTVAKQLGFTPEQIAPGLITPLIGNTYSAASMIGLAATLDAAKPGDKILVTSFGSGAGSDAFHIEVTDKILDKRNPLPVLEVIKHKIYIDYGTYAKHRKKLIM